MAGIVLENVDKTYANGVKAVDSLSLDIADGEFMVFVGPSGCGKSTALRTIAGLEEISGGTITIGGRQVNNLPPKDRDIAMVFQSYALYPHMTVEENLAFGLQLRKVPKEERKRRVHEAARMLGIEALLQRKPAALSGGQRQRVAMGRAIVREPQAFLMDEPLSNLDAKLRVAMRASLNQLHERLKVTTIYVTHDQVEAMTLGDRVAVLRDGRLQQVGSPQNLYDHPVNVFVGGFMGSPSMNLVEADLVRDNGAAIVFGGHRVAVPDEVFTLRQGLDKYLGKRVVIGIRPADFEDAAFAPGRPTIDVKVQVTEDLGSEVHVIFTVDTPTAGAGAAVASAVDAEEAEESSYVAGEGQSLWTARVSARSTATPGQPITLAIDAVAIHFFDRDSGLNIGDRTALADAPATAAVVS
ncbi:MAG: multiple sugar transport system ATP-binding protein [Frankiaceae bacterium]|jgi:multiple sugar transport system ATP-binding protein|nr:multiple sugar transport system ATP-binding protein [Frankiaceae bacterium]MDQ1715750.1 multiple sugar transport system ATP-binding protein [Frankiaceae bacterium]MDQ1723345.1 multiple sugar transport system ATP-binding protein [Frankiaceae bacterium]